MTTDEGTLKQTRHSTVEAIQNVHVGDGRQLAVQQLHQLPSKPTYPGKNERTLEVEVDHEGPDGTVVGVLDRDDGRYARHTHCPQGFRRSNHAGHCDVTNTSLLTTLMLMHCENNAGHCDVMNMTSLLITATMMGCANNPSLWRNKQDVIIDDDVDDAKCEYWKTV